MLAKIHTCTITGIDALPVEVEVETGRGEKRFSIIGLADSAVRESRDRVTSALKSYGYFIPEQVLVNLAPAELKKEGAAFDLPIAIGILAASGQLPGDSVHMVSFHGELALDGSVRRIQGAVALAAQTAKSGIGTMVLPSSNCNEAGLIPEICAVGAHSLLDVIRFLRDGLLPASGSTAPSLESAGSSAAPFADVIGQETAKRALMIAAAGGHNVLMIGPPGCGKSMLAQRFPGLLPRLRKEESLEVLKIHSIAGQDIAELLLGLRPFRSPHHSISTAGLIGGGSWPRPGEISLAHKGVLFLDEFPEYSRAAIEALRLPLECGMVDIVRAKAGLRFPAEFQLIAAMNPCPCGRLGVPGASCACSPSNKQSYLKRLSQPILDRIDMHVELEGVPVSLLCEDRAGGANDEEERLRVSAVEAARKLQIEKRGILNARARSASARESMRSSSKIATLLEHANQRLGISTRAAIKVLKVAQTIADLENDGIVGEQHVAEALSYRCLERIGRYLQ